MIKIKARNERNSRAIAYRDVGNEREQGRGSVAAFHNAEIDYFGFKLIVHDLCRGSICKLDAIVVRVPPVVCRHLPLGLM